MRKCLLAGLAVLFLLPAGAADGPVKDRKGRKDRPRPRPPPTQPARTTPAEAAEMTIRGIVKKVDAEDASGEIIPKFYLVSPAHAGRIWLPTSGPNESNALLLAAYLEQEVIVIAKGVQQTERGGSAAAPRLYEILRIRKPEAVGPPDASTQATNPPAASRGQQ